jgi:hypothetical protein
MVPLIRSRQLVTVSPVQADKVEVGDIVLCRVSGATYLHLVSAVDTQASRVQISNNHRRVISSLKSAIAGLPRRC